MPFIKGYKQTEEHKKKIGLANSKALKGRKRSPESRKKQSATLKEHYRTGTRKFVPHNKSEKWYIAMRNTRGKNHCNWKGGTYGTERHTEMSRIEHKQWRNSVFERDNYTCQLCGEIGGHLNAHHIKPWVDFPKLRIDTNNGITFCSICHYDYHYRNDNYLMLVKE